MVKRVVVVPHDKGWAAAFVRASSEAAAALGPNLVALHHIGSTSVPGIHAKPVIDMLAVVGNVVLVDPCDGSLEALGYVAKGEFGIPGRRYFYRNDAVGVRTHQIHAFEAASPAINRHLAFRDYLIAHPQIASTYSELKRQLAAAHSDDVEAYMDGKDPFIKEIEAKALAWATARGWPAA